jgi:hypothetical protein
MAYRFLQGTAPTLWARLMAEGLRFHVSKEFARLSVPERAGKLAEAEAQRLARARLFHLDALTTGLALELAGRVRPALPTRKIVPAEYGLLVWAEPVGTTEHGDPFVACHWQVMHDGVWLAWWTDTTPRADLDLAGDQTEIEERLTTAVLRGMTGRLSYDREFWLPYGPADEVGWKATVPALERALLTELIGVTITTWSFLTLPARGWKVRQRRPSSAVIEGTDPVPGADDTVTIVSGLNSWSPRRLWMALRPMWRSDHEQDR